MKTLSKETYNSLLSNFQNEVETYLNNYSSKNSNTAFIILFWSERRGCWIVETTWTKPHDATIICELDHESFNDDDREYGAPNYEYYDGLLEDALQENEIEVK